MATTKSLGQKDTLDKFYTQKNIALDCINFIDNINLFDCIIEPSAGDGSFSKQIPNCLAYDIQPEGDNIQQADWLLLDKEQFKKYNNILVIGNPPFGQQNTLAVKFFNESSKIANVIAFILPLSFKKHSIQNRLNLNFHLIKEKILDKKSFTLDGKDYSVPCVFQVWEKKDIKRKPYQNKTTTELFDFVDKNNADFRIQRVGGNAGKASFDLNFSIQSNYFIKNKTCYSNEKLINIINQTIFPELEYTVGPKSLSKTELILTLEEKINNIKEKGEL